MQRRIWWRGKGLSISCISVSSVIIRECDRHDVNMNNNTEPLLFSHIDKDRIGGLLNLKMKEVKFHKVSLLSIIKPYYLS